MNTASRRRVRFCSPGEVEVITERAPVPAPDEVRVRTRYSAVSPGTEHLVFRGEVPEAMDLDLSIKALEDADFSYPLSYGYACVGEVESIGEDVSEKWFGARVFGFQPHVSRFVTAPDRLVRLPKSVSLRDGVMIPSLETAVNLVMDAKPTIGEKVVVLGQGVVGLLTTRILADFPLMRLVTVEPSKGRRVRSKELGADVVVGPDSEVDLLDAVNPDNYAPDSPTFDSLYEGADLVLELTGRPAVLNDAIRGAGFDGRIVVGSWYGRKRSEINLGDRFHRSRLQIVASQVSTIAPRYRGRWTKSRRMSVVLDLMENVRPARLISDEVEVENAPFVYEQLGADASMLQPIFVYE